MPNKTPPPRPAVFLDRDGTINEQMGYINHISRFRLLPGIGAAIARLNQAQLPVVMVSNQSGLARGYFPATLLDAVHDRMHALLARDDAHLDGMYICPHHPEAVIPKYRKQCDCRKPAPGLLFRAAADLNLDLRQSFMVGDRWSDVECGQRAGAYSILVLTGYGRGEYLYLRNRVACSPPTLVAENLDQAVTWILQQAQVGGTHPG